MERNPDFVEQVKEVWKDNPLWYGICYENYDEGLQGFWGELRDPYDPNSKTLYFLGHTKSQVIPRMKTCLSFLKAMVPGLDFGLVFSHFVVKHE